MKAVPLQAEVMDVTLRDGSYLVDFQFTADDTATLVAALEAAGVHWIEVGHGLGLHAGSGGYGAAAATDEEYLEAAAGAVRKARWGMFFIPGIGREEDLRLARRYQMSFLRIGTNITEVERARPFFELAAELGFVTSWNGMKSYVVAPEEFARRAAQVRAWGADVAYLVDSAGGMYPEDIARYLKAARNETDIALGFHGHDNLSLAMANSLRAIDCGAVLIDASLQGMGRSGGNAITEVLVAIMRQRGLWPDIDIKGVMDVGQSLIRPLIHRTGLHPLIITAGSARFHSSYIGKVRQYARRHNLDVRDLITRLCREDQMSAPDELLDRLSHELAAEPTARVVVLPAFGAGRPHSTVGMQALQAVLKQLRPQAVKQGKPAVINVAIADAPLSNFCVSGNIQATFGHVVAPVLLTQPQHLVQVLEAVDGLVEMIFLDIDRKPFGPADAATVARGVLKTSRFLTYSDGQVRVGAIEDQATRMLGEALHEVNVVVAGSHPLALVLTDRLQSRGCRVVVWPDDGIVPDVRCVQDAALVIVWPGADPWFGAAQARHLRTGAWLMDAGVGAILPDGLAEARRRGAWPVRINMWPMLSGVLAAAHESARVQRDGFGWANMAGVDVVSGGALGEAGTVVVDDIHQASRVIGVTDGQGRLRFDFSAQETERVRRVTEEINRLRIEREPPE